MGKLGGMIVIHNHVMSHSMTAPLNDMFSGLHYGRNLKTTCVTLQGSQRLSVGVLLKKGGLADWLL